MRTRTGRFLLLVFLLLVGSAATVLTGYFAREVDDLGRAGQSAGARVDRLLLAVQTIGDALQTYVVAASSDRQPAEQIPMLIADFTDKIAETDRVVRAPRSKEVIASIGDQARSLGAIEAKAQEHIRLGQDLMASDVISAEARDVLAAMRSGLVDLRAAEISALEASRAGSLQKAWSVIGAAAAVWTLGLLALVNVPRHRPATVPATPAASAILALSDPQPKPAASTFEADLKTAADVCTAIGRLSDARELPPLLTQSGSILGASGVVVWLAAGDELIAASAHGYDSNSLNRLGPIHRAALNATAAAWRTGTMQVVDSDGASHGALVAPMWGTDRCIGVLAVELPHGRETDGTTQAVARFLAAQLAATLAPWPAASVADAERAPLEKAAKG